MQQFNSLYGTDVNDVESWRKLCLALNLDPLPDGLDAMRKVSRLLSSPYPPRLPKKELFLGAKPRIGPRY